MPAADRSKKRSTRPKRTFATTRQIWPKTKLTDGTILPNVTRMRASCRSGSRGCRLRQLMTFRLPGDPLWTQTRFSTGLPDLWLTGRIGRYHGNKQKPFRLIGPTGTVALMQNLEPAFRGRHSYSPRG